MVNFSATPFGEALNVSLGFGPALELATMGCSHMTTFLTGAHALALATVHDANIMFDARPVFVGETDAATTLQANPGHAYGVGSSTPDHLIATQLPKFLADVAAGFRAHVMMSDFNFYNRNQSQANCIAKGHQVIDAFFDETGNDGLFFIVIGTWGNGVQDWNNYWENVAKNSAGRIHFFNPVPYVANLATTTDAVFAPLGGIGVFGSAFADGAHLSAYGQYRERNGLGDIYRRICPATFPRRAGMAGPAYDPAAAPYADLLGPGHGMIGTNGADVSGTNGGVYPDDYYPGTIVGSAAQAGGGALWQNRWAVEYSGINKPAFSITTSPDGGNEQTITLAAGAAAAFSTLTFQYTPVIATPNGGNAARRFMAGIEVEYEGATGFCPPSLSLAGDTTGWPIPQANADGLPDDTNETFRMRTLRPIPLTAANPKLLLTIPFRNGAEVGGSIIRLRNGFCRLYGEA